MRKIFFFRGGGRGGWLFADGESWDEEEEEEIGDESGRAVIY